MNVTLPRSHVVILGGGPIGCDGGGGGDSCDEFDGNELDPKWELVNPSLTNPPTVAGGHLNMPIIPGDLFGGNGNAQMLLQGEHLARIIAEHRPTMACGVPTIWNDLLRAAGPDVDLSSFRTVMAGGSAVPRALIEAFEERVGVPLTQGWGMTETSPVAALAVPPRGTLPHEDIDFRVKAGRVVAGVEVRVAGSDGQILPNDGESVGEFEIRGPWITGAYYKDPDPERFHDGWLRTGDVGTLDPRGFMTITDRTKDVIKSGGEWISSVELENEVMAHPQVFEAAVVGVPDPRWQERPLVVVVPGDQRPDPEELVEFLHGRVARWWLPERWAFIDELPKTSVGKFDKKALRAKLTEGDLDVVEVEPPRRDA